MGNMIEIKNWMSVFNSRIEIVKEKISDRISNFDILE